MRTRAVAFVLLAGLAHSGCSDSDEVCHPGDPCIIEIDSGASPADTYQLGDHQLPIDSPPSASDHTVVQPDSQAPSDVWKPPIDLAAPYSHEDVLVQQVHQWVTTGKAMTLLDVREPSEFQSGHIASSINMPWISQVLHAQYGTLSKAKPIVVYCNSGNRSNQAATFLVGHGFKPVYDMLGGIGAWKAANYPITP